MIIAVSKETTNDPRPLSRFHNTHPQLVPQQHLGHHRGNYERSGLRRVGVQSDVSRNEERLRRFCGRLLSVFLLYQHRFCLPRDRQHLQRTRLALFRQRDQPADWMRLLP